MEPQDEVAGDADTSGGSEAHEPTPQSDPIALSVVSAKGEE
jgi:hypothetical protein